MFCRARVVALCAVLSATCAVAAPITIPFSTPGVDLAFLFSDGGDTFTLTGLAGTLLFDTTAKTTNTINAGTYLTNYTNGTGTRAFPLSIALTLNGVTNTLTQPATWTIALDADTFVTDPTAAPVFFSTPAKQWKVTLVPISISSRAAGTIPFQVQAEFEPVPEPSPLWLVIGGSLVGVAAIRRKRPA